jgi:DNA helicase-2/ATP-dependent DNA helicase PcrA
VAFTRAEDILIISDSEGQSERGSNKSPSRFLFDFNRDQLDEPIPISDKQVLQYQEMYSREQRLQYINETDEIKVGNQVEHPVFGAGMIKAIDSKNYLISFEKLATDRTIGKHVPIKVLGKQSINILKTTDDNSDLRTISVGVEDDAFIDTTTCSIGNENQGVEVQEENTLMDTGIVSTINVYEQKVDQLNNYIDPTYYSSQIDERVIGASVEVIATDKESESVSMAQLIREPETVAKVAVEHPIWGKGFITESHESHIAIRFPEINEVKLLPKNTVSIRRLQRLRVINDYLLAQALFQFNTQSSPAITFPLWRFFI